MFASSYNYGVAHEGGIWVDDNPEKVPLADFGFRLGERFLYEYDFYDLWKHDVRLEKVLPSKGRMCPVCTGGRRLAPLEDCGGARVYMEQGDPRGGATVLASRTRKKPLAHWPICSPNM